MHLTLTCLAILSCLWDHSSALQVAPNSTCSSLCLNDPDGNPLDPASSWTNYTDIACSDSEYAETTQGFQFQNCLSCLQNSTDVSGTESDTHWYLYNLRYAVDVCLFGFPARVQNISSPCNIDFACAPLKGALEAGKLDADSDTEFGYCSAGGGAFSNTTVEQCVQCLQASTDQVYTSNFLLALQAGCDQQPKLGQLLGLSGTLFSDNAINVTAPPPAPSKDSSSSSNSKSTSSMTTGAIVGIAIGAALLLFGGLGLFCIYHRKQKKLYDMDPKSGCHSRRGSSHITPPMSDGYTNLDQKNFSSLSDYELRAQMSYGQTNADYYDKLEQELVTRQLPRYTLDPNKPGSGPTSALPTHQAYNPQTISRNSPQNLPPRPPAPVKSNKPDSYALQAYLSAAEDSTPVTLPPPPPRPASSRLSSRLARSRTPSPNQGNTGAGGVSQPPPPPKGSPPSKVPALNLPSVPRIRVPKKYSPPSIQVQEATPDADHGEGPPQFGLNISLPIVRDGSRSRDSSMGASPERSSGSGRSSRSEAPLMRGTAVDDRTGAGYAEVPLGSGKNLLYGA